MMHMMHDVVVLNCVYIALSNDVLVRTVRSASIGIFVLFFHLEGNSGSQNDYHLNLGGWNLFQPPKRTPPRSGGKCGAFGTGVS